MDTQHYEKYVIFLSSRFFTKSTIFKTMYQKIRKRLQNKGIKTFNIDDITTTIEDCKLLNKLETDLETLHKKYITNELDNNSTIDLKQDYASSLNNPYVDLKIMEEYYKNSNERNQLLNYINKKYNTNFNSLYRPSIFTSKFNKKLDIIINEIKNNIYNYIYISIFFIAISLQNLLIQFNIFMVHIYISIILILFIFMYYYTNTL